MLDTAGSGFLQDFCPQDVLRLCWCQHTLTICLCAQMHCSHSGYVLTLMITSICALRMFLHSGSHSLPWDLVPHTAKSLCSGALSLHAHPQISSGPSISLHPCSSSLICSQVHHPHSDHIKLMTCHCNQIHLPSSGLLGSFPHGILTLGISSGCALRTCLAVPAPGHALSFLTILKCTAHAQVHSSYLFMMCLAL